MRFFSERRRRRKKERSGLRRKKKRERCWSETVEKEKSLRLKRTYRFDEDRRAAARDAGRRRAAEEAAAVAAKPREAREADADVGVDIADAAAATTFLLASDAATAPVLLFRLAAAEAAPVPVGPIAIAARIATGAVLRDATREPENEGEREG